MKMESCNIEVDNMNKEVNLQGTLELPVAIYNDDLTAHPVPYHWHDEIELIVVITGEMELVVELKTLILKSGEGIFINTGRLHSCINSNGTDCTIKSFVFHSRFIYGELNSILYENYFHLLLQETTSSTHLLTSQDCNYILSAYDTFLSQNFAYEFAVREYLTKVILSIIKNIETKQNSMDIRKIKQMNRCKLMMAFIQSNYSKEITLLDIAKSADVKESEALRCFKNILHTSPIRYLKKYRLEQSAFLLKTTTKPIIDIGLSCGFFEMSYFSRSFKELYNTTPTIYRTQHQ